MTVPNMKPGGRDDATPRYGNGSVKMNTDIGTAFERTKGSNGSEYTQTNMDNQRKYFQCIVMYIHHVFPAGTVSIIDL